MHKIFMGLFLLLLIRTASGQALFPSALFDSINAKATTYLLNEKPLLDIPNATGVSESGAKAVFSAYENLNRWHIDNTNPSLGKQSDTLFVGLTPGDSLYVSGAFSNNGSVVVYGDGILIFDNAQAFINGDIIVWGTTARIEIINSTITSPQAYLYQRGMMAVGQARIHIENSILNYSGLSHSLVVTDSAKVSWLNVTKYGFTTCGLWLKGEIDINGTTQAGEFIMMHETKATFANAHTVLIWHHIPDTAQFNMTFPNGNSVASWSVNSSLSSIQNIAYEYSISNCTDVMWGLMPEPGSQTHITNSELRTVGLWFKNQSGFHVSGLVNSSQYANFTAPLNDRNLILENTFVRTWSLYMFENAEGQVDNCILGEIGTFENSQTEVSNSMVDGSGGYIFAENTSFLLNGFSYFNCDFYSKDNAFVFLVYGAQNWGRSIAMDKSIMFIIQSNLSDVPEIFNDAMVWYLKLEGSSNLYADIDNSINGSAWIDKGSNFYQFDFSHYTIDYKHPDSINWLPICGPVYNQVYNSELCNWNTTGIAPGAYLLKLSMWDNTPDSNMVEAIKLYNLHINNSTNEEKLSINNLELFPNPASQSFTVRSQQGIAEISISDVTGRLLFRDAFENGIFQKKYSLNELSGKQSVLIVEVKDKAGNIVTERLVVF